MRKRGKRTLLALAFIVAGFVFAGVGAMLAFFVLAGIGAIMLFFARLYPSNRALEDLHEREDSF